MAYGKLGGIELGYGSDLDLVFVHDADPMLATDGERAIENGVFFTRLGQRIIHVLTAYTPLGPALRGRHAPAPLGCRRPAGFLAARPFASTSTTQAWTWEHQALVRARPVAGCPRLAARFEELRREVLGRPRELPLLRRDVIGMREKMRAHLLKPETSGGKSPSFHVKQSVGGIVDIEFMVQYCVLAWSATRRRWAFTRTISAFSRR